MNRTKYNGHFNKDDINQTVSIVGWVSKRRNFGNLVFLDIRDRSGIVQVVFNQDVAHLVESVKNEYVVAITGVVSKRLEANPHLASGEVEILATSCEVINEADVTPMIISDNTDALEDTRLKYRYLDLRRPTMQAKLITRAKIVQAMRSFLDEQGFIDVETPMLTKSTPEGSREYLVPSRVHANEFYALAQSPQIFKQLLMIGGLERYYQVARCFRDEDLRADRQLDFTQVDIEASFIDQNQLLSIMEAMMVKVMKEALNLKLKVPFKRLSFEDALNTYGSDKPDLRYGYTIKDVTEIFQHTSFEPFIQTFQQKGVIKALVIQDQASMTRKGIDQLGELAKKHGAKGLVTLKMVDHQLNGPALKFFSQDEIEGLIYQCEIKENDLILLISDQWEKACTIAGALRSYFGSLLSFDSTHFEFVWIVDFPLFEKDELEDRLVARHHPFTRPFKEDEHLLDSSPLSVRADAYDLVCNGYEVAGGSQRIYKREMQQKMFELIGFSKEQIQQRFGFFVDAFNYGTPPHGGIAFGLDRLVMVLTNATSLRDVIAFPKNANARCPITQAPSQVTDKQLAELHLTLKKDK